MAHMLTCKWMQATLAQYFNAVQFPESHLSVILVQTFTVQSVGLHQTLMQANTYKNQCFFSQI